MSKGARFGNTQYSVSVTQAVARDCTTLLKFRRSPLNLPTTKRPKVNAADKSGVEKADSSSAIAVTIDSSAKVNTNAFNNAGSTAGASQAAAAAGPRRQAMYART